jgi:hypothetical protein
MQMLYEIGDPGAYILPDVICDWRYVKITDLPATEGKSGPSNRVLVEGARGRPPTPYYKTSGTYASENEMTLASETITVHKHGRNEPTLPLYSH